ncbi:MAG: hypothetical protein ACYCO0_01600 [Candidatus Micrarchaeaceae archaeon]
MDYNECIDMVNSAEAHDTEARSVIADIYDLGKAVEIKQYSDAEASAVIEYANSAEDGATEAKKEQAQQPNQILQKTYVRLQEKNPARGAGREMDAVAKELESAISNATKGLKAHAEERMKQARKAQEEKGLVMVTLSLQDQIGELEKISAGIDSGAFTEEQMAIIKTEVKGLMKAKGAAHDAFQANLLGIRDGRLKEVSKKLGL